MTAADKFLIITYLILDKIKSNYILESKLKKTKTKFLRFTGYLNSIKFHIKQDLLLILVLVRQQNFLKLLTSCLTALKNMLSRTVSRYMRDPVKIYFGLLKIQLKF